MGGITGIMAAGFVAGGLLKGTGEAIEKEAEENRQAAIMALRMKTELDIADKRAVATVTAAKERAGGTMGAAGIRADAEKDIAGKKITSEEGIAKGKNETAISVANIHAGAETDAAALRGSKFVVKEDGTGGWVSPDGSAFTPTVDSNGQPLKTEGKETRLPAIPATIEYLMKAHGDQPGMSFEDAYSAATQAKDNPAARARVVSQLAASILQNDTRPSKDAKGNPIDKVGDAKTQAIKAYNEFVNQTSTDGSDTSAPAQTGGKAPGIAGADATTPPADAGPVSQPNSAPGSPGNPLPTPPAGSAPATGPGGAAALNVKPGQTIWIKGVPHTVSPDGRTAVPVPAAAPAPLNTPTQSPGP